MESPETAPDELLKIARAGSGARPAALGQLLEMYRNYLRLLVRVQLSRRLQGKLDDSDVVQEAFLEAYRHFDRFRGTSERELTAWLRQVLAGTLANTVRRYFGTQRRDVRLERQLEAELDRSSRALNLGAMAPATSPSSSPSQQASRREQAVLLADALEQLPPDYREIIILSHLEGLSFPEAAKRMDRTLDSVKNLWARALGKLRRALGTGS